MTHKRRLHKVQKETRIVDIGHMYVNGWTQMKMAEHLGVSQPAVHRLLKELRERWRAASLISIDDKVWKEIDRINWVEAEATEAWLKSKEDTIQTEYGRRFGKMPIIRQEQEEPTSELVEIERTKKKVIKRGIGNEAFLDRIYACIELRLKLIGALKPDQAAGPTIVNINWSEVEGRPIQTGKDYLEAKLNEIKALPPPPGEMNGPVPAQEVKQ
jgi:predicted transcriptional regulator